MYLSLPDLMRQQGRWPLSNLPSWEPEWRDEGPYLILRLSLKGLDPRTVQVQVAETALSVAGSRSHEERTESDGYYRASAAYGSFARTLPLPIRVLPRQSLATWQEDEILEVRLKKA